MHSIYDYKKKEEEEEEEEEEGPYPYHRYPIAATMLQVQYRDDDDTTAHIEIEEEEEEEEGEEEKEERQMMLRDRVRLGVDYSDSIKVLQEDYGADMREATLTSRDMERVDRMVKAGPTSAKEKSLQRSDSTRVEVGILSGHVNAHPVGQTVLSRVLGFLKWQAQCGQGSVSGDLAGVDGQVRPYYEENCQQCGRNCESAFK